MMKQRVKAKERPSSVCPGEGGREGGREEGREGGREGCREDAPLTMDLTLSRAPPRGTWQHVTTTIAAHQQVSF